MISQLKWILLLLGGLFVLQYVIRRDIRYSKEYRADLRNRIVGARMIEDGRSPYFYHWKSGDGLRYYDPQAFDTNQPSISTSTPFLHHLLTPIADLPQARILNVWLVIQYVLLTVMTGLALRLAGTAEQRQAVLLLVLIFLVTNAWKSHIREGQTYLLIPFFALAAYVFIRPPRTIGRGAAAGAAAACLALLRPNTLVFLLPFLFLLQRYPFSWKAAFLVPVLLLGGWVLLSPRENSLWHDYARMVQEQIKVHQDLPRTIAHHDPDPHFKGWEGVDMPAANSASEAGPVKVYSENGNFFVLFRNVFHRKLSVAALEGMCITVIIALLAVYAFQRPWQGWELSRVAIFAYCLYMITDLFSPVYRHQHYEVQWLMPLLIAAATWQEQKKLWYGLLFVGLFLGCIHLPFIKMENTIGEYLILAALLGISLLPARSSGRPAVAEPAQPGLS
jgi:Glycosyltransferase family 87